MVLMTIVTAFSLFADVATIIMFVDFIAGKMS